MIEQPTANACIAALRNAEQAGATGFAISLAMLEEAAWTPAEMRRIFRSTGRPCMPYAYRNWNLTGKTDAERAALLLRAAEEGAEGCDVMGDLYDPSPRELTRNPDAIARQKRLMADLRERGAEVLLSSHMNEALSAEEIVAHLQEMERRGADIAKIVTVANTEEEFLESLRATVLAKRALKVPFVQLCNGRFARLQRYAGPALGSMLTFTVPVYDEICFGSQPLTAAARRTLDELTWHQEYD